MYFITIKTRAMIEMVQGYFTFFFYSILFYVCDFYGNGGMEVLKKSFYGLLHHKKIWINILGLILKIYCLEGKYNCPVLLNEVANNHFGASITIN